MSNMLKVRFGKSEHTVWLIDSVFDNNYEEKWFSDPLIKEMILDVDGSTVVSSNCIVNPVLGQIPPTNLSRGVKALILMLKEPEWEVWATACGNNCAKWIRKIAGMQDITISLEHFLNFGNNDFEIQDAATGEILTYWKFAVKYPI